MKNILRILFVVLVLLGAVLPHGAWAQEGVLLEEDRSIELKSLYAEAIELYKQRDYAAAKEKFLQVQSIDREYESVDEFLKRLDEHIAYEARLQRERADLETRRQQLEEEYARQRELVMEQRLAQEMAQEENRIIAEQQRLQQETRQAQKRLAALEKELRQEKIRADQLLKRQTAEQDRRYEQQRKLVAKSSAQQEARARRDAASQARLQARQNKLDRKKSRIDQQMTRQKQEFEPPAAILDIKEDQPVEESSEAMTAPQRPAPAQPVSAQRRRHQKDLLRMADETWHEITALYKAQSFDYARDQVLALEKILSAKEFPPAKRASLQAQLVTMKNRIAVGSDQFRLKQEKIKQRQQEKIARLQAQEEAQRQKFADREARRKKSRSGKRRSREDQQSVKEYVKRSSQPEKSAAPAEGSSTKKKRAVSAQEKAQARAAQRKADAQWKKEIQRIEAEKRKQDRLARLTEEKAQRLVARHRQELDREQIKLKQELSQGVDQLYRDALRLYQRGTYDLARNMLDEVDRLWPDYKQTRKYLATINAQMNVPAKSVASPNVRSTRRQEKPKKRAMIVTEVLDQWEK